MSPATTLKNPKWEHDRACRDAMTAVTRLKQEVSGNILVAGSRTLVNALKQHDLVDEYQLMVFPLLLGSGMRLFDEAEEATTLKLVRTLPMLNGAVVLTYQPARGA